MSGILSAIRNNRTAAQVADIWLSGGFYRLDALATGANTDFLISQSATTNVLRQFKPGLEYILTNGNTSTLNLTANGVSIGKSAPASGVLVDFTGGGTAARDFKTQADNGGGLFSGAYFGALFAGNTLTYGYISVLNSSSSAAYNVPAIKLMPSGTVIIGNGTDNSAGVLQVNGNFVPSTSGTRSLGTTTYKWNELFVNAAVYTTGDFMSVVRNSTTGRLESTWTAVYPVRTVTGATSLSQADWGLRVNNSAAVSIILPGPSAVTGKTFWVKKISANSFPVTVVAAEYGLDYDLVADGDSILIQSDGAEYCILAEKKSVTTITQTQIPLADFYTDQGNTSTTANVYTALYSYNIPANTLNANGQKIVAHYSGSFNGLVDTVSVQVFFNGVGIGTSDFAGTPNNDWQVSVMVVRTGTSTARAVVYGTEFITIQTDLTGLDFTGAITIALWGASDDTAGGGVVDAITAKMGTVEWKAQA